MIVKTVNFRKDTKKLKLSNRKNMVVSRFCCLGEKDKINYSKKTVHAECLNGKAKILPIYKSKDYLKIGTRKIPLVIKEIQNKEEIIGYHKLEEYHYRGKILHGRRVPLIAVTKDPFLPKVLGYIELATSFMMNKPRALVYNAPFSYKNIQWDAWDKTAVKKYTNLTVRIARCVVSPEFRGVGLSKILTKHAIRFAKKHWQVGKLKPYFLEITADMLRYVPFVESAGMYFIGNTEGNLDRLNKDMKYILKNYDRVKKREILKEESSGIVDMQVFYATQLKKIQKDLGAKRKDLLELLLKKPEKLPDKYWDLLHKIFRFPKPTFLVGLNKYASNFIKKRIEKLNISIDNKIFMPHRVSNNWNIELQDLALFLQSNLVKTKWSRKIQQAFGVSKEMLQSKLFSNLSLTINSGDIVLICGPSGAGKTTLLNFLKEKLLNPKFQPKGLSGISNIPKNIKISVLGELKNAKPVINSLDNRSFEESLYALNISGLAEAHLYVKRFSELSNGQRYRAMIAKLIASKSDIWLADEFCATLDPNTANIVSKNIRKSAKATGKTVILAAANWGEFIKELMPDKIVYLKSPWEHEIFNWKQFKKIYN